MPRPTDRILARKARRRSYSEALLAGWLRKALARLSPNLPAETLEDVLRKLRRAETPSHVREEKRRRQFVLSTHDANIPVLGDAELILGLATTGEATDGQARIARNQTKHQQ